MVCMVYGRHISSFLLRLWNDKLKKKDRESAMSKTEETQTVSRYKQETKDASTQYQKQIARMLRKATRIRPGLDTYDLQYFKGH